MAREIRACIVCGANFSATRDSEFCPVCMLRRALAGRVESGESLADYTHQFVAILGTRPVSFSLSTGVLPPGMTLSSAGLVSGVSSTVGTFDFTTRATDAAGSFAEQLCVLQVFAPIPAPAGLVGWWRAQSDAQDSAGTNHGVLRNGAGFAAGRVGQAFALDGKDDCIEIPDTPSLRPVSVTLEAWVAFDVTSGLQVIIAKARLKGTSDSYALWLESGTLKGAARDAALSASFSPEPGSWHHLAYTFDNDAKQQVLYIDGIQVASGRANSPIAYNDQPLRKRLSSRFGSQVISQDRKS